MPPPAAFTHLPYRPNVGIVLLNGDGRIWMGRQTDGGHEVVASHPTPWGLPQGGIDPREDPALAAHRELQEETGVTSVRLLAQMDDWIAYDFPDEAFTRDPAIEWRGQRQRYFAFAFEGADSEVLIDIPAREFWEWRWGSFDELIPLAAPFKRPVYERVAKEFAPLIARIRQG